MSYHKIIIVGNLGRDPEMRYTPNGSAVTTMNVATNRVYTDQTGQRVKETTWFRVPHVCLGQAGGKREQFPAEGQYGACGRRAET